MKKFLLLFLGIILGTLITLVIIKYFRIQLFAVEKLSFDTSPRCGVPKNITYCYDGQFCSNFCNLCNCAISYCYYDETQCPLEP